MTDAPTPTSPLHILFLSTSSGSRGGGELYLLKLGQALADRGHTVSLACAGHARMDELAGRFEAFGQTFRIPLRNCYDHPTKSLAYLAQPDSRLRAALKTLLDAQQPDVIHLNKQNLEDGLDLIQFLREQPRSWLQTIHIARMPSQLGARWGRLRSWVARRYVGSVRVPTIVVSEAARTNFRENFPSLPRPEVIVNGSPVLDAPAAALQGDQPLQFVALSRLHPQKRPDRWLAWVERLHEKFPDAHFTWVGDGPLEAEFTAHIHNKKLSHITYAGWQANPSFFLQRNHYLLHSADYEGLPFAWVEAAAHGLPIICSQTLAEAVPECSPTLLLWEMITAQLDTLADPAFHRERASTARKLHAEAFSIDQMAGRTMTVYHDLLNSRP